jgi:hypothetical protein
MTGWQRQWLSAARGGVLPFAILALVVLMIVPVPSIVLDIGFVGNIMISLAVLMVALNAARPLDFSAFPDRPSPRHLVPARSQRRLDTGRPRRRPSRPGRRRATSSRPSGASSSAATTSSACSCLQS